ncbi:MAG TPA: Gfo/Idh/MocA family oxidoreductase [Planctomycetota bacterium]|nr:Gfo/Idh/MocA family oxidoreductase [Planctomycetota bacterium]
MGEHKVDVLVIGGGMICEDCVLPTIFQERRRGNVGRVTIVSLNSGIIQRLRSVFPNEEFVGVPDPATSPPEKNVPDGYKALLGQMGENGLAYVTTPDHLHTRMVLDSIQAGLDVVCMKPLCLKVAEAWQIIEAARERNAYVFTEYHKRRDRAVRALRYRFRRGDLGEPLYGHAWIEEPKYMPLDKFKLWAEKSSPFEYIGTHYADVYHYVTGLKPKRIVAFGQRKYLPKTGSRAYDAVQAAIQWEDGSAFWIQTSWVCPDNNAQMTQQGMMFQGTKGEYKSDHANRNCYFVTDERGFEHYNPNFMKPYDDWDAPGVTDWTGYGYESNAVGIHDKLELLAATEGKSGEEKAKARQKLLADWESTGCRALPAEALIGVAVNEAVRLSVDSGSRFVVFDDRLSPRLE